MRVGPDTPARQAVLAAVHAAPGSSIAVLAQRTRIAEATARYHLARLVHAGLVVAVPTGRVLAHYPPGWGDPVSRAYVALPANARVVLGVLRHLGLARASDIARWTGLTTGACRAALDHCEKRGFAVRWGRRGFYELAPAADGLDSVGVA